VAYAGGVASTGWPRNGREPLAPLDAVKMARKKMWVRHDKAGRETDYRETGGTALARARLVSGQRYCEDLAAGRRRTA